MREVEVIIWGADTVEHMNAVSFIFLNPSRMKETTRPLCANQTV